MKKHTSLLEKLFANNFQLIDGADEIFELDLALWEYEVLSKNELIDRSAYFRLVDGKETAHFKTCNLQNLEEVHKNSSFRTKVFFLDGKYSTGYATHGLFPYRGKFHPQLIKGLINILGIDKGEIILDPMAGSGTTNIEAALMGINSYAIDVSPFCQLMIKTKYEALTIDLNLLKKSPLNARKLFAFFRQGNVIERIENIRDPDKIKIYNLIFLAYLDALGYSKRVVKANHEQLFEKVLP